MELGSSIQPDAGHATAEAANVAGKAGAHAHRAEIAPLQAHVPNSERYTPLVRYLFPSFALLLALLLAPISGRAQEDGSNVIVGAGDISSCDNENDSATGDLIEQIDGTVMVPGDIAYQDGTEEQFAECYDPAWGSFKHRTRPVPGNHEYNTSNASGYYQYFGAAAGDPAKGYYSYDVAGWHVVALNSNCGDIGDDGCHAGSAQERWLRDDLAGNASTCTLAYWHHPRFSSGDHGDDYRTQAFVQALYEHGADVLIVAHDHDYERFAPQDPAGQLDEKLGIRQFVVGTGGKSLRGFGDPRPNSEIRESDTYGVIKLTLHADAYDWEFVPVEGSDFTDNGSETCHDAPSVIPTPVPVPDEEDFAVSSSTALLLALAVVIATFVTGALGFVALRRSS